MYCPSNKNILAVAKTQIFFNSNTTLLVQQHSLPPYCLAASNQPPSPA